MLYRNLFSVLVIFLLFSCSEFKEYNQAPELESLQQGIKISAAIGYCASVVVSAAEGRELPENVFYNKNTGLIRIKIDKNHPLPFNKNVGDILIAFTWSERGGLMSVLFGNLDLTGGIIKLYGLHLVPVMKEYDNDGIVAILAKQDIIIGNGSDTLLDMSNIPDLIFNSKIGRLNDAKPENVFVAVKQNIWFMNIDQNSTSSNVYDDNILVNGGGQMVEVKGASGGIIYNAMIGTKINYSVCKLNPTDGFALLQNFKAGGEPYVDLGNSLLSFHSTCNGKAHVEVSTGKYFNYFNKDISLGLN